MDVFFSSIFVRAKERIKGGDQYQNQYEEEGGYIQLN
jgi:hypothetical protein